MNIKDTYVKNKFIQNLMASFKVSPYADDIKQLPQPQFHNFARFEINERLSYQQLMYQSKHLESLQSLINSINQPTIDLKNQALDVALVVDSTQSYADWLKQFYQDVQVEHDDFIQLNQLRQSLLDFKIDKHDVKTSIKKIHDENLPTLLKISQMTLSKSTARQFSENYQALMKGYNLDEWTRIYFATVNKNDEMSVPEQMRLHQSLYHDQGDHEFYLHDDHLNQSTLNQTNDFLTKLFQYFNLQLFKNLWIHETIPSLTDKLNQTTTLGELVDWVVIWGNLKHQFNKSINLNQESFERMLNNSPFYESIINHVIQQNEDTDEKTPKPNIYEQIYQYLNPIAYHQDFDYDEQLNVMYKRADHQFDNNRFYKNITCYLSQFLQTAYQKSQSLTKDTNKQNPFVNWTRLIQTKTIINQIQEHDNHLLNLNPNPIMQHIQINKDTSTTEIFKYQFVAGNEIDSTNYYTNPNDNQVLIFAKNLNAQLNNFLLGYYHNQLKGVNHDRH